MPVEEPRLNSRGFFLCKSFSTFLRFLLVFCVPASTVLSSGKDPQHDKKGHIMEQEQQAFCKTHKWHSVLLDEVSLVERIYVVDLTNLTTPDYYFQLKEEMELATNRTYLYCKDCDMEFLISS